MKLTLPKALGGAGVLGTAAVAFAGWAGKELWRSQIVEPMVRRDVEIRALREDVTRLTLIMAGATRADSFLDAMIATPGAHDSDDAYLEAQNTLDRVVEERMVPAPPRSVKGAELRGRRP